LKCAVLVEVALEAAKLALVLVVLAELLHLELLY
jgi:hypothetical protein